MSDIYFTSADSGLLVAGELLRTTDGGTSWTAFTGVPGGQLRFFNDNRLGYCGAYRTTDRGASWTQDPNILADVCFPSDSVGYTCGYDGASVVLGKTIDSGRTWKYTNAITATNPNWVIQFVRGLYFRDDMHGFVEEGIYDPSQEFNGTFSFFTSDGGVTWTARFGEYYQLLFLKDSTWISGSYAYGMYRTDNDFQESKPLDSLIASPTCDGGSAYALSKSDNDNIAAIGRLQKGAIYRSTDAGESWHAQFCFTGGAVGFPGGYGAISLPTRLVGYAVGIDSQVYKTIDGGGPPFTSSVSNEQPCNCTLAATPNPASHFIDITFDALASAERLEIFDALGKRVLTAMIQAGSASYRVDVSQLSAGAYLARVGHQTMRFVKE